MDSGPPFRTCEPRWHVVAALFETGTQTHRLELTPDDPRACSLAATACAVLHDVEKSMHYAERVLAIDPNDPTLLCNLACTYARLDKREA